MGLFDQKISKEIWDRKWRYKDETYDDFITRISQATKTDYWLLYNQYFSFGGRVMASVGTNKKNVTYSNCYVIPIQKDSMEGIMKALREAALTMKSGGGVGYNFSILRPKNDKLLTTGGKTSGALSFLYLFDSMCETIRIGNDRRGAQIAILDVWHPNIEDYIVIKRDGSLKNFNISIGMYDKFMQAVENDEKWDLIFPDYEKCKDIYDEEWDGNIWKWIEKGYPIKVYKTVRARELYDKIMKSNYEFAEPGLFFIDTVNKYNPLYYAEYIAQVNPCQPSFATVMTPNGIREFKDIKEGDIIWSGKQWTRVVKKWWTGKKPVYKYITSAGVFIGTENHKVVSGGEKIEIKDTDCIDIAYNQDIAEKVSYNLQAIVDGLVIGDGTYHKSSNNILLCVGKDDYDYFNSEIKDYIKQQYSKEKMYKVITTIIHEELPKTYLREIPERYFKGDFNTVCSFLRGLFSANGSLCGGRVTLKQTSRKLIEQVQQMLSFVGIRSYITVNKGSWVKFRNGTYYSKENYTLNITTDRNKFYKYIGFIQKYKQEKLKSLCETISKSTNNKITYDIIQIEYLGEYDVFDITVDAEEHTYWTGCCLVSNCGEIPLSPYGSCNLGSINLAKIIKSPFTDNAEIDFNLLKKITQQLVIGLDNVLDINWYPLPEQKEQVELKRQIGIGITGLGDMLAMLKLPYDSEKAINIAEKVMNFIANEAYRQSAFIAKEKGSFPLYDEEKFLNGEFVKRLDNDTKETIRQYGIRNSKLITIAPTGTLSIVLGNVSSGLEPIFNLKYIRKVRQDDNSVVEQEVCDYAWLKYKKMYPNISEEKKPEFFKTAIELDVDAHVKMQYVLQKWVDNSISKTINVPIDYPFEDFKKIYYNAWKYNLKGCTTYRPNNIVGSVLEVKKKEEEVKKEQEEFYEMWKEHIENGIVVENVKLPQEYPMRGYEIRSEGKKWRFHVAFKDKGMKYPFAIFIQTNCKETNINTFNTLEVLENLALNEGIPTEWIEKTKEKIKADNNVNKIARMLALLLRHNVKLEKIINALDKVDGLHAGSLIFRLKKFLASFISGDIKVKCPQCGGDNMVMQEGCVVCRDCGYSKCG